MGKLDDLKDELIAGHPDTGAYDADDAVAAEQLNAVNRTINRATMTASEVINAVDVIEFNALTDPNEAKFWNLMGIGDLNPFGVEATILTNLFGGGSTTITALAVLRKTAVSRVVELGLGVVKPGHVEEARRL